MKQRRLFKPGNTHSPPVSPPSPAGNRQQETKIAADTTDPPPLEGENILKELLQFANAQSERLTALERMVRYTANENMTVASAAEELKSAVATVSRQLADLDGNIKGILNTMNRREEENQQVLISFRRHFTEQIAQLEARIETVLQVRATDRLARKVLPAIDDLDLILSEEQRILQSEDIHAWLEATDLIRRNLMNGLATLGLEVLPIDVGSTLFDPNLHEAVPADAPHEQTASEDVPRHTVLKVKRNGYLLGGDLYRPARVIIKLEDSKD